MGTVELRCGIGPDDKQDVSEAVEAPFCSKQKAFGLDVNACRGLEELYTLLEDRAVIVNLLSLHLVCILFSVVLVLSTLFRFSSPWS